MTKDIFETPKLPIIEHVYACEVCGWKIYIGPPPEGQSILTTIYKEFTEHPRCDEHRWSEEGYDLSSPSHGIRMTPKERAIQVMLFKKEKEENVSRY